jgi:hypothetical protein
LYTDFGKSQRDEFCQEKIMKKETDECWQNINVLTVMQFDESYSTIEKYVLHSLRNPLFMKPYKGTMKSERQSPSVAFERKITKLEKNDDTSVRAAQTDEQMIRSTVRLCRLADRCCMSLCDMAEDIAF